MAVDVRDAILFASSLTPRGVGRVKLMYMLFLADAELAKSGDRLLDVRWIRRSLGPYSREVDDTVNRLLEEGKLRATPLGRLVSVVDVKLGERYASLLRSLAEEPLLTLIRRAYELVNEYGVGEEIDLHYAKGVTTATPGA